ncbi:MAG: Queuine tRNA-ribosyltransferase [Turneriella sp.]|nr:Queuine tRNA-ribosyltransferase [Turneriella sp.]
MQFTLEKVDGAARAGTLQLNTAEVKTPVFMPVGTQATVKAITQEDLSGIGYRLILGNTYHLYLRPGSGTIATFGGLQKFMAWPHATLTDSGGYQAFSLSQNVKLVDDGVIFRSHLDGSKHHFTPEKVIEIERQIGADIIMPIDDCAPYPADGARLKASIERTYRWLVDCKKAWLLNPQHQNLFGIAQGGVNLALRKESAKMVAGLDLPGYAIGGLSVGEPLEYFSPALEAAIQNLPHEKPRYVMGVGSIPEILYGVERGVDMFDCVLPTRNARNGQVFSSQGKINLRNEKHAHLNDPIDPHCNCKVCKKYSLGYIRHLHKQKEILGLMLSTYHNLHFMFHFMQNLRDAICRSEFLTFKMHWLSLFK